MEILMSVNESITKTRTRVREVLRLQSIPTAEAKHLAATLLERRSAQEKAEMQPDYELFLDLLETRHKLTGLGHALDGLREIILSCFLILRVEDETAEQIIDSFSFFGEDIGTSNRQKEFFARPLQKDNIIIYFPSERRRQLLKTKAGRERWNILLVAGYRAIRLALDSAIATQTETAFGGKEPSENLFRSNYGHLDDHAKGYERAIFKTLKYIEPEKLSGKTPITLDKSLTSKALLWAMTAEGEKFDSAVSNYINWATAFLADESYTRDRLSPRAKKDEKNKIIRCGAMTTAPEPNKPLKRDLTERESAREIEKEIWTKEVAEQVAEGASHDEFTPPLTASQEFDSRPGLDERARIFQPVGHIPAWHKSLLTQEKLGVIISRLRRRADSSENGSIARQLFAFVVTQTRFGFAGNLLVNIRIRRDGETEKLPNEDFPLLYDNGFFHIHPKKYDNTALFGAPDSSNTENCLTGSHSCALLAPPLLKNLLDSLVMTGSNATGQLFNTREQSGELVKLDLKTLNNELKEICSDFRRRIDLNKIGRSAAAHLINYGEADELLASFISGFLPRHLGAQAHYVNVLVARLQEVFDRAGELSWDRLCDVSKASVISLGLPLPDEVDSRLPSGNSELVGNTIPTKIVKLLPSGNIRFGSPFVPDFNFIRQYFKRLRDLIDTSANPFERFNCLTIYSVLCTMYLTGLRAIEIDRLTVNDVSISRDDAETTLNISGKCNRFFDEWRVSRLLPPHGALLAQYKQYALDFAEYLTRKHGVFPSVFKEQLQNSFFFFIEDARHIAPVTTDNLRDKLRTGVSEETKLEKCLLRVNSPRHFFATTALESGIPRRLIDTLVGHSTQGREPLNRYSLLSADDIKAAARAISHAVAERLEISPNLQVKFI